jgi:hypothetical protein
MKIIHADDQMFGNEFWTTIGEDITYKKQRPLIAHDCGAIAKHNDTIYWFEEDDGHYWSTVELKENEIPLISTLLSQLRLCVKHVGYATKFTNKHPKFKIGGVSLTLDKQGKDLKVVTINLDKDRHIEFGAFYLNSVIDCFKLKERPYKPNQP